MNRAIYWSPDSTLITPIKKKKKLNVDSLRLSTQLDLYLILLSIYFTDNMTWSCFTDLISEKKNV